MRRLSVIVCAVAAILHAGVGSAQTLQIPALDLTGAPAVSGAAEAAAEGIGQFQPRPVPNALPHFGLGVKAGTLGIGIQAGTALASRVNVRGGINFFDYRDSFSRDGARYDGTLRLRSVEAKLDLFVVGGFRVTPGLLLYNDNGVSATASVGAGQSFTLGGTTYLSNTNDSIRGTAALTLDRFAPTLGIGFGNLLPRSARHFSLSTDLGVVFQGRPQFALALSGSACAANGTNCLPINSVTGAMANIQSEQTKINDDLKPFKYYPEVSLIFGYRF